jgi:hypothetical protein
LVAHSIFAKAKEHKWFQLSTGGNTNDQWANFDLENGVIGNSSSSDSFCNNDVNTFNDSEGYCLRK